MTERRRTPRLDLQLPSHYRPVSEHRSVYQATVVNVGGNGLCFVSSTRFKPDAEIELQINLRTHQVVTIKTKVIWIRPLGKMTYKVGVKIINATREDEEEFIRFYCHQVLILPRSRNRILIIDDEKDMVELLKIELEQQDYEVVCAYDGQDGYEKFLKEKPDLVILDMMLPKLNGFALCRKIRWESNDVQTPILMLSAHAQDEDRIIGRVIGAEKYMAKPFNTDELLSEIKKLCHHDPGL